ncbi:MAG: hypothetical protein BJG00_018495 [Limnothrix sp. CACIAM 69d]|nr:MAG: hypothetical protein BJG00_018495 [Limnothrix sp. CACIAM 69d]
MSNGAPVGPGVNDDSAMALGQSPRLSIRDRLIDRPIIDRPRLWPNGSGYGSGFSADVVASSSAQFRHWLYLAICSSSLF